MKAVLCKAFGPPEALAIEDIPEPVAGRGEAVIRVKAAGLNFFDTLSIEGKYQFKPSLPFSPAAEVAGIVESVGPETSSVAPGDRVCAFIGWGGAREKVAAPARRIVKLPDSVPFDAAGALTVSYGTTLHALAERGRLQPGETLAVLGASGGTGQAAIELGKLMGARVIACASSPDRLAFCTSLGADETVDYSAADLKEALKNLTGGAGVDVIYDPVGGALAEPALRSTGWGGRYLVIGFASGEIPKLPLNLVLLKGCDVVGVFWGSRIDREPERHRANMERIVAWCAEGKIAPRIQKAYPLAEAAEALRALSRREVKGKVILSV